MSVFANLIPGAREVRAPLAAGGILLLALALAIEPNLSDSQSATGLTASLIAVHEALGPVGQGVVVAFIAYLVGSMVQSITAGATLVFSFGRGIKGLPSEEVETMSGLHRFALDRVQGALREMEEVYGKNSLQLAEDRAFQDSSFLQLYEFWVRDEGQPGEREAIEEVSLIFAKKIATEGYLIQRRLMGVEPEWFAEVDRFEAEAELREAIGLPLLTLGTVCALRSSGMTAAIILSGSILFTFALLAQGRRRRRRARNTLADAVVIGRVKAPCVERFDADVQLLLARTSGEKPRSTDE
jgi:hypothetical protein